MNRTFLNLMTDALAAFVMLAMVATGIVLRFSLPPGTHRELVLWGLTRHEWGDLHFWLALAALGVVLIHLVLHWTWVVAVTRRWVVGAGRGSPGRRARVAAAVATVAVLILSLAGFWSWSRASVRSVESSFGTAEVAQTDVEGLRGSMTLAEAAAALGFSMQEICSRLAIPDQTPETVRLGQIARERGGDMQKLRQKLK